MAIARQSRPLVAVTPINRTVFSDSVTLLSGAVQEVWVQNATLTDSQVIDTINLVPPGSLTDFELLRPVSGNLLNVAVYCADPGIELYIDEAGNDLVSGWLRADQLIVTPGLPTFERAFRFILPFAKITIYNSGASTTTVTLVVRCSTS